MLDLAQIPGYAEAQRKEQEERDLAFCDWLVPLCGLEVRQFSLLHLIILGNCDNAFVSNADPKPEDVAFFLWVVSPQYRPNSQGERDAFCKDIGAKVKFVPACAEIAAYLDRAFQDMPAGSSPPGKSYTSFVAPICDLFAREYGWDDQAVIRKPVARLFQLLRRIEKRTNPKAVMFNRSDSAIAQYLRASGSN